MARGRPVVDLLAHFMSKLIPDYEDDHWALDTKVNNHGYHVICVGGRNSYGHIVAYELTHGPVPDGLEIDHLCRTTWCCNPDHLEAVTHSENVRRAYPVCGAGLHDMTNPENYYQRANGGRMCKPCNHRRNRARNGKR